MVQLSEFYTALFHGVLLGRRKVTQKLPLGRSFGLGAHMNPSSSGAKMPHEKIRTVNVAKTLFRVKAQNEDSSLPGPAGKSSVWLSFGIGRTHTLRRRLGGHTYLPIAWRLICGRIGVAVGVNEAVGSSKAGCGEHGNKGKNQD
jgi:hypothetical protein